MRAYRLSTQPLSINPCLLDRNEEKYIFIRLFIELIRFELANMSDNSKDNIKVCLRQQTQLIRMHFPIPTLGQKYISANKMAEHDSISVNVRNLINSIEQCDKSKIWQKMFISNLQLSVDRNWHRTILFYFKCIKQLSKLQDWKISNVIKLLQQQLKMVQHQEGKNVQSIEEIIIEFYIWNSVQKKLGFLAKVISIQVYYISQKYTDFLKQTNIRDNDSEVNFVEQLIGYYLKYCRAQKSKQILFLIYLRVITGYFLFLKGRLGDSEKLPFFNPLSMMEHIFSNFEEERPKQSFSASILNSLSAFVELFRFPLFIRMVGGYVNKDTNAQVFISKLFSFILQIDSEDNNRFIKYIMLFFMKSGNPQNVLNRLIINYSSIEMQKKIEYYQYFTYFFGLLKGSQLELLIKRQNQITPKQNCKQSNPLSFFQSQLQKAKKQNMFQSIRQFIEQIYVEMTNSFIKGKDISVRQVERIIKTSDYDEAQKFIAWLPYLNTLLKCYQYLNNKNFYDCYKNHLEFKLYVLIASNIKDTKKSKDLLIHLQQYVKIYEKQQLSFNSFKNIFYFFTLMVMSNDYHLIGRQCVDIWIRSIHMSPYAEQFHNLQFILQEIPSRKGNIDKIHLFSIGEIISTIVVDHLQSYQKMNKNRRGESWIYMLSCLMKNFLNYFESIDEEIISQIRLLIHQVMGKKMHIQQINSIIKANALKIISIQAINDSEGREVVQNIIEFYQSIYIDRIETLTTEDIIYFIDFCFNVKSDLYNILNLQTNSQSCSKEIRDIVNRIDQMQFVILQSSARKYIQRLWQDIIENNITNFIEVLSITVKSIYFSVYQQHFYTQISQKKQGKDVIFNFNFQQQLQQSVIKLISIKEKCHKIYPFFKTLFDQSNILFRIAELQIRQINMNWNRHIVAQLNDLMYINHLIGFCEFKDILISIRLSIIYKPFSYGIFLLELAKYNYLQIFNVKTAESLAIYVRSQMDKSGLEEEYRNIIELLLEGNLNFSEQFARKIFKIMYLMRQHEVSFFHFFRDIFSYLAYFLYKNSRLNGSPSEPQKVMIKQTQLSEVPGRCQKQYWIRQCWEEGWIATKLVIILNRKILGTALNLNQTSSIDSFLSYTQCLCIRSGHLGQLLLPLKLSLLKKKPLDLLKIIDLTKRLEMDRIKQLSFKQIQPIALKSRNLICMQDQSINQAHISLKIQQAFGQCIVVGIILAQLFNHIIAEVLHLDYYQNFIRRYSIPIIFNSLIDRKDRQFLKQLNGFRKGGNDLDRYEQLAMKLANLVFTNYPQALILKDYIGKFIDSVFKSDNCKYYSVADQRRIDRLITYIALCFEGCNYRIKQFLFKIPQFSLSQSSADQLVRYESSVKNEYQNISNVAYPKQMELEMEDLIKSNYPVTIFFPIGERLFCISCHSQILVTYTDLEGFQEKLKMVQQAINKNNNLLTKQKDLKLFSSERQKMDKQLHTLCQNIDLGIADINVHQISIAKDYDPCLIKLAHSSSCYSQHHLKLYLQRYHIKNSVNKIRQQVKDQQRIKFQYEWNDNILTLIHSRYLHFPFELVKSIRQSRGIYRLPSIRYLTQNQDKQRQYDTRNVKYLVNTHNDLPDTEKRFQEIRKQFTQWKGIKGRQPELKQLQCLLDKNLFLYMGHGSGMQNYKQKDIYRLQPKCPMLMFGCSSAKMNSQGSQPFGHAYSLLLKGCPAYLGCLWLVTDYDIDRVTLAIFLNRSHQNLSLIIDQASKLCHFKFLNCAAIVIYGLPVYLH